MLKGLDLDFLPVGDREILARALHDDPAQRFPNCVALIDALARMTVTPEPVVEQSFAQLPLVLPCECLLGKPLPPSVVLPQTDQLVAGLIATVSGPVAVLAFENVRFWQNADGSWESRCPVQVQPELLPYKLEGFRQHWRAHKVSEEEGCFVFRLVTHTTTRGVWPFRTEEPAGLEITLQFSDSVHLSVADRQLTHTKNSESAIRIRPFGEEDLKQEHGRRETVRRLFQSVRAFLQAGPEQRAQQRWPLNEPLRVYPILPNLEVAGVLEARVRNISQGGLSFLTHQELASDYVYLHLYQSHEAAHLAILARALRMQPLETGQFEVGVTFSVDGPTDT